MAAVACSACGATTPRVPWGTKDSYHLERCTACGLVAVSPIPASTASVYTTPDYFSGATQGFGYVDYDADKEAMRSVFEAYLARLERVQPAKGKLLDVGAATGFFVGCANARGWSGEGIEIADYAAAQGRARGLSVRTGTLADLPLAPTYAAVTLLDVIEHVSDPRGELAKVRDLLVPGGVILITTPDVGSLLAKLFGPRWHLVVPPEHLFYFTKRSMRALLESLGFRVLVFSRPGKRFSLRYFFATVARWCPVFPLPQIARTLARHPRAGDIGIPFNTYDNLMVIAQKP